MEALLLLHVPPIVALLSVRVPPTHTLKVPVIAAGNGDTVTTAVVKHPVAGIVYVMVVVPTAPPVANPVPERMVATPVVLLIHTPPEVVLLRVATVPGHSVIVPVMAAGSGFPVAVLVVEHPVTVVYESTAVPAATPVTFPDALATVAIAVFALLHVPPVML